MSRFKREYSTWEISLVLVKGQRDPNDPFSQRVCQILLDMRLQQESLESLLRLVSKSFKKYPSAGQRQFFTNLERVAFDATLPTHYTNPMVEFLKEHQSYVGAPEPVQQS
ncbi:MAG: hypothetical protein WA958_02710 [Tunicatimonas sp.]